MRSTVFETAPFDHSGISPFSGCKGTTYFSIAKIYFIFFYIILYNRLFFCIFIFITFLGNECIFALFFLIKVLFSKNFDHKIQKKDSTNMLPFFFVNIQTIKKLFHQEVDIFAKVVFFGIFNFFFEYFHLVRAAY